MKFCEGFALILSVLSVSFATDQTCKWIMDVLEMVTDPINGETEFRLYQSSLKVGGLYFVRLRISCENQVNPFLARSLVHSGYTPLMRLDMSGYGLEGIMNTTKLLYSEGALVQFQQSSSTTNLEGNFLVLNTSSSMTSQSSSNCTARPQNDLGVLYGFDENVESPHCNETHLCELAWLVPLTVDNSNVVVSCSLTNPGEIEEASLTLHSRGLNEHAGRNEIGEIVTDLPDGIALQETMTINNVPLDMPFWLVDGFLGADYTIFTDSEFERTSVIKLFNVSQNSGSEVCPNPCSAQEIKGTTMLPDRILLSTCFGIQELRSDIAASSCTSIKCTDVSQIVLRQCIRKIIVPPQAFPGGIQVLAIEESSAKIFATNATSGADLEYLELQDTKDRTLCEFLALDIGQGGDCTIHDATINLISKVLYVFLVSYSSDYFVVRYSNNEWDKLFSFPSTLPNISQGTSVTLGDCMQANQSVVQLSSGRLLNNHNAYRLSFPPIALYIHAHRTGHDGHGDHWILLDSSTAGSLPVYLTGISFTRSTGSNIYVWGNVLFYSPNTGEDFLWLLDYNLKSNITVFTSAEDGSYAFLTETQQVWWGHTDSVAVHYVETANEWNIGLMTRQTSDSCTEAFIILSLFFDVSGQLWKVIRCENETSSIPCVFRSKVAIHDILSHSQLIHEQTSSDDDIVNMPSMLDYGPTSSIPKHCLKYSIVYRATHTSHHLQHVVDVINVPYMVNTVPVSVNFLKEYLDNQRASLRRPNIVDMSETKNALPQYIYLKKGDVYNFTVSLTLESGQPNRKYDVAM